MAYETPDYLKQSANPSWSGIMNNMVRALIDGAQQQPDAAKAAQAAGAQQPTDPMSLAPPGTTPMPPMSGGAPPPYMNPQTGGPAANSNPMLQALMTPPPSPYGAGSQNAIY